MASNSEKRNHGGGNGHTIQTIPGKGIGVAVDPPRSGSTVRSRFEHGCSKGKSRDE
jgi:hypothetical protein